ncbi:ArgP/LysG family DNA-binding transcriptional regulator [Actinokineospora bangkokensis]|nr:ArgP/LysG family DNA-binding transcriptional regulator [Actinokineospora bangkokensis]
MLDPECVRTLLAVVDEGTLDAAAKALHVTPSAVSQRIKQLEQRTGRVLLVRGKPARLTEPGEVVARHGRAQALLDHDTRVALGLLDEPARIAVAVNADSLSTWFRRAIAALAGTDGVVLTVHRDDEGHTADWLRRGQVIAAVNTDPTVVQGCRSTPLGSMRYHAAATASFAARRLSEVDGLAAAPVVAFDEKDRLQDAFCRARTGKPASDHRHFVADSHAFEEAVSAGLGWAMLTEHQVRRYPDLVLLAPDHPVDVPLHWQQWKLDSPTLSAVAAAVTSAARAELHWDPARA